MDDPVFNFIRRLIRFTITLVVMGVLLNDGIRVVSAFADASGGLKDATNAALTVVQASPEDRDGAQAAAAAAATARGATLEAYEQQVATADVNRQIKVAVSVSAPVVRTIVAAPVIGLVRQIPPAEWYSSAGVRITLAHTKQVNDIGSAAP